MASFASFVALDNSAGDILRLHRTEAMVVLEKSFMSEWSGVR